MFDSYVILMVKLHDVKQCVIVVYCLRCGIICKCDFLSDASSLRVKNKVQRYYLTSNVIKYYDYNLWKIVLVTKAIQFIIVDGHYIARRRNKHK